MAVGTFFPRNVKNAWGIACNQNAQGELYVGKGMECRFDSQFSLELAERVQSCLAANRGDRNGRFWMNLETSVVTMQVGDSASNETLAAPF